MTWRLVALGAAAAMAGCNGGNGSDGLSIEIDGPVSPAYTNGILTFQVDVNGRPDRVELRRDGALLVELSYPYLWAWDTATTPEEQYAITAHAIDGEDEASSDPVQVVVDRTAPQIVTQSPEPDADDVDVFSTVTVAFDEPVTALTVEDASIVFASGNPVFGAELSADGLSITLPAASDFLPVPNVATVDLTDVRDRAGNPVASGTWSYTIPAWLSLGEADRTPDADAGEPTIAIDGDGNPVIAFLEDGGASLDLVVSRWNGTAWVPLGGSLEAVAANDVADAVLVLESTGAPLVAWIEWDAVGGGRRELRAARWTGSQWTALGGVLNATAGDASAPALIPDDGSGVPMLAWNEGGRIRVARRVASAWTDAGTSTLPAQASARGTWLSAEGGTPLLAARNGADGSISMHRFTPASTWTPHGNPIASAGRDELSLTWDTQSNLPVVALIEEISSGDFVLQVREFDGGASWFDIAFSSLSGADDVSHPRITNAPIGQGGFFPEDGVAGEGVPPPASNPSFQIVWQEGGDVRASVFDFFEWVSFGTADRVPASAAGYPAIADDGERGVYLAWREDADVRIGRMNRR